MKETKGIKIHTGISSLLMVFVILCLVSFGLLSYSTARADNNLTEKAAAHTNAYYQADLKVEEKIAEIDSYLNNCNLLWNSSEPKDTDFSAEFVQEVQRIKGDNAFSPTQKVDEGKLLLLNEIGNCVQDVTLNDNKITFAVTVDDTQQIEVIIDPMLLNDSKRYSLEKRQLVNTKEFNVVSNIEVWEG